MVVDGHLPARRRSGLSVSLFLRLHTLPERMAHKSQKLQFEIVAVLGLLALFTHVHIFWVAGLLLALIDIPDFGGRFAGWRDRSRRSPASRRARARPTCRTRSAPDAVPRKSSRRRGRCRSIAPASRGS